MTTGDAQMGACVPDSHARWRRVIGVMSVTLLVLWTFPFWWYTAEDRTGARVRVTDDPEGWQFEAEPVSKSVEAILVAESMINGTYSNPRGESVRVFRATRRDNRSRDIGLFVHTPDRCWSSAGWRLVSAEPDHVRWTKSGVTMQFERRIFRQHDDLVLVYFGGLVDERPLPFRLDHNFGMASGAGLGLARSTVSRFVDPQFWGGVWDRFVSRLPAGGTHEFIRVSVPVSGAEFGAGDWGLGQFLDQWLVVEGE